jgi:protein SCO1
MRCLRSAQLAWLLICVCAAACGAREYEGQGVVRGVLPEEAQVSIEHDAIPGLMEAMTTSYDVPDRALLALLSPGMTIRFTLRRDQNQLQLVAFEPTPAGLSGGSGPGIALAAVRDPAPDFDLIDQDGRPLRLTDLRGSLVLLDFVFTHCTGPCPILTSTHVALQRRLPPALRARVHFVSISLDPARDTPEALRRYALARGADLSSWSFLTGPVERVDAVLRAYGVGKTPAADGQIQHTLATFAIDPEGRIAQRYLGLEHDPDAVIREFETLL